MKKVSYDNERIQIIIEKKKLFGGISQNIVTIPLKMISIVRKEVFEGKWNSMCIFMIDGSEEFITNEEMENKEELNNLFEFFITNRNQNDYKLKIIEISTLEEYDV